MAKVIAAVLLTQIVTNSWWACFVYSEVAKEGLIALPVVSTVLFVILTVAYLVDNWEKQ